METILSLQEVFSLWHALDESKHWPKPGWAQRCIERPECVVIGANETEGGEVFAVIDLQERRVLPEDEFSSELLHKPGWQDIAA